MMLLRFLKIETTKYLLNFIELLNKENLDLFNYQKLNIPDTFRF